MANLYVVQFMHPGGEHEPDQPNARTWNRENHQRTFLRCHGTYLEPDGRPENDDLVLWGEWEPPVRILSRNPSPREGFPHFVCEPRVEPPISFDGQQNTDPFVFGERFLYGICQQHTKFGPTGMQSLNRGSLILFGSRVSGTFHLDTLFVVDLTAPHTADDFRDSLPSWAPPRYRDMVLAPWYAALGEDLGLYREGRLYGGATFNHPVQRMYSFFPCLPAGQATPGFARPEIRLPNRITDALTQGRRLTRLDGLDAAWKVWDTVVHQVGSQGLLLGIQADLPKAE